MIKSIRDTSLKFPFCGKHVTDEDLRTRYTDYLAMNPVRPNITVNSDKTASLVTTYFEDAEPKVSLSYLHGKEIGDS